MKTFRNILAILLTLSILSAFGGCGLISFKDSVPPDTVKGAEDETEHEIIADGLPSDTIDNENESDPVDTTVTISMVGDILLHERVYESGDMGDGTYNYDHFFANVEDEIEAADIAIVNQEVILGGRDIGLSGYPSFNGAFEVGDAIADAGFDIVLHATNHTIDRGSQAVRNCLDFWSSQHPEIAVLGIHDSAEDQSSIYVREENGIKIAFLNYTYGTNGIAIPSDMPYCVDLLERERLVSDIARAEEMADFTVVLPHWGTEYVLEPDDDQKYWTQIMFDCGVDLVIGTHPHVIEPVELIETEEHSMLVYYSIGNFINSTAQSGSGIANRMVGGMANVTLDRDENGDVYIKKYGVTPLVTHVLTGPGLITTYLLSEYSEDLARENEILLQDSSFSFSYCLDLVRKVFGDLAD